MNIYQGSHRSPGGGRDSDRGASLIGLLSVVLILGVLAVIVLSSSPSSPPLTSKSTGPGLTAPNSPSSGASLASLTACKTDFLALSLAVTNFRALNGANPPRGTSWATTPAASGAIMQSWPSLVGFSFTWTGSTINVVPKHGVPSMGDYGSAAPPTGCYAH
ncbi:MAG: hypothetical protein HKL86_01255 [Acidimicrobiaceae bacterium]|nr:hypothetical protein [Acidimicrobiaceae bacterium]